MLRGLSFDVSLIIFKIPLSYAVLSKITKLTLTMTDVPSKHVCENLKSRIIFENLFIFAAVSTIWSNNLRHRRQV